MRRATTHIVLLGAPGCGKSRTGSVFARQIGRPFLDANSASDIPSGHLLHRHRSPEVDEAERAWLGRVLATSGPLVVSAPWEVLDVLESIERDRFWGVWLAASSETLTERLHADDPDLSAGELATYLEHYAAMADIAARVVDVRVRTDDRTPDRVAAEILKGWRSRSLVA